MTIVWSHFFLIFLQVFFTSTFDLGRPAWRVGYSTSKDKYPTFICKKNNPTRMHYLELYEWFQCNYMAGWQLRASGRKLRKLVKWHFHSLRLWSIVVYMCLEPGIVSGGSIPKRRGCVGMCLEPGGVSGGSIPKRRGCVGWYVPWARECVWWQ